MESATDRYVAAATRRVADSEREDIADELRAAIEEATAARLERNPGLSPTDAERSALLDIGDPAALAARYAGHPLHLLASRVYPAWRRTLTLLLCTIVPITMVVVAVATSFGYPDDAGLRSPGEFAQGVFGAVALAGINAVVHCCFWCTLLFLLIERRGIAVPRTWSPDRLPPTLGRRDGTAGLIGAVVASVLVLGTTAIDALWGLNVVDGHRTAVLSPSLWPWGYVLLSVIVAAGLLLAGITWQRGRSRATAVANTVICLIIAGAVGVLLAFQRLFNDDTWGTLFHLPSAGHQQTVVLGSLCVVAITVAVVTWRIRRGYDSVRRPRPRS